MTNDVMERIKVVMPKRIAEISHLSDTDQRDVLRKHVSMVLADINICKWLERDEGSSLRMLNGYRALNMTEEWKDLKKLVGLEVDSKDLDNLSRKLTLIIEEI